MFRYVFSHSKMAKHIILTTVYSKSAPSLLPRPLSAESELARGAGEAVTEVPTKVRRGGGIHLRRRGPHRVQEHTQGHQVFCNACQDGELVQGSPTALGKKYVDTKFEVAFRCKFIL